MLKPALLLQAMSLGRGRVGAGGWGQVNQLWGTQLACWGRSGGETNGKLWGKGEGEVCRCPNQPTPNVPMHGENHKIQTGCRCGQWWGSGKGGKGKPRNVNGLTGMVGGR